MNSMLISFLYGLAGLGPVLSLGLLPSSYQAMFRRPAQAMSYSLAAGIQIPMLATLGWLVDRYLIPPLLTTLLLPISLIIFLWGLQASLGLLLGQRALGKQISFFNQGCLLLGTSLYLHFQFRGGLTEVLAISVGWSLGFMVSTTALTFLLRKIDSKGNPSLISGWPIFLLILSCFWLATKGLTSLFP